MKKSNKEIKWTAHIIEERCPKYRQKWHIVSMDTGFGWNSYPLFYGKHSLKWHLDVFRMTFPEYRYRSRKVQIK